MANCSKNYNYHILNSSGQQIRNTALSADGKELLIKLLVSGTTECTFNINSSLVATGLHIMGTALQIVDAHTGLTNTRSWPASQAKLTINNNQGNLEFIGDNDVIMGLQANIRYDAASDEVVVEY